MQDCEHHWVEMYYCFGQQKNEPLKQIQFFFCENCLNIISKIIDMSQVQAWVDDAKEQYKDY